MKKQKLVFNPSALKTARIERRIYVSEIAERLNVTSATIYNWESGKRNIGINELCEIAYMTNKPIEYFLCKSL